MVKLTGLPAEIILMIINILRPRLDGKLLAAEGHEEASSEDYHDTTFAVSDLLHENSQKRHALASFSISHRTFTRASVEQNYSIAGVHKLSVSTALKRMISLLRLVDRNKTVRTSIRHLYVHTGSSGDVTDLDDAAVATLQYSIAPMGFTLPYLDSNDEWRLHSYLGYCVGLILIRLPKLQEVTLRVSHSTLQAMTQVLSIAQSHHSSSSTTTLLVPTLQALSISDVWWEYDGELDTYLLTKPGSESCFHSSVLGKQLDISTIASLVLDNVQMEVPLLAKTVHSCEALRKLVCVRFASLMMSSSDLDALMNAIQYRCETLATLCLDLKTWHYVQDQRLYDRIATLGELPNLEQLWITICSFVGHSEEDNIDSSESQSHNSNESDTDDSSRAEYEVFETFLPSLPKSLKRLHLAGEVTRPSLLSMAQRIKMGGLGNLREIGLSRGQWDDELEGAFAEYVPSRTRVDPRPALW